MSTLFSGLGSTAQTGVQQQDDASPSAQQPPLNPQKDAPPNPYDIADPKAVEKIKGRISKNFKKANNRRYSYELLWLRNIFFFLGIQWVRIDWRSKEIRNLMLPADWPRSITNTFAKVNSDLMSSIIQGEIPLSPMPETDDAVDVGTAEVAERIREVIDEEICTRSLKRDLGFWLTLTGNTFLDWYYDYDPKHGSKEIPQFQCTQCGDLTVDNTKPCAACGGPPAPPPSQLDATGVPIPPPPAQPPFAPAGTTQLPIGKLCADVLSPYEIYWDNTVRLGTGRHRWYMRPHRYSAEEAKAHWPDFAAKISDSMPEPMKMTRNYLVAIAYAGSYLTGLTGIGDVTSDGRDQLTAWVYQELPCDDYPEGIRAVQMGNEILELGPLPNEYGAGQSAGQKYLPLTHFYMEASGGAWGKPRANDLASIQARRNIIASNMQKTFQRTGSPKLLNPIGSGIKSVTGESGQILNYKPITFGGTSVAKPEYLEAALGSVQASDLAIQRCDSEMETIAGTHFVTGADVPSGVTAASALAFLGEKANQSIAPIKEIWVEGWRQGYGIGIELARQHWTDQRILAFLGPNKEWQFLKFKAADLKGAVRYRINYDAMFPKSQATERANIVALAQIGAIMPGGDPEQDYAVLEKFGATDLRQSMDRARQQAMREWDLFINQNQQPILLPIVQDSAIHLLQHKIDAQSQEFENLLRTNKEQADLWIAHIQATAQDLMAASMPLLPGGPPSPTAPGGHAGSKVAGSQHGSQNGPAAGNLGGQPAPIRKGEAAAGGPGAPSPTAAPIG